MLKINVFWEMKRERVFLQNVEKTLLIHTNLRQYTIHLTVPLNPIDLPPSQLFFVYYRLCAVKYLV